MKNQDVCGSTTAVGIETDSTALEAIVNIQGS